MLLFFQFLFLAREPASTSRVGKEAGGRAQTPKGPSTVEHARPLWLRSAEGAVRPALTGGRPGRESGAKPPSSGRAAQTRPPSGLTLSRGSSASFFQGVRDRVRVQDRRRLKTNKRGSRRGSAVTNPLASMRMRVRPLASHSGLRIWRGCGRGVGWRLPLRFDPSSGNLHMPWAWP